VGVFGGRNDANVAAELRKKQIAAKQEERKRIRQNRADHLAYMAAERAVARAAIVREKGPQEHFPKAQRRIK